MSLAGGAGPRRREAGAGPRTPRRTAAKLIVLVLLAAPGLLTACRASPPPQATLRSAAGASVQAQASRWCPAGGTCKAYRRDVPALPVPTGSDVTVEVDGAVAERRPWIVLVEGASASPLQRRSRSFRLVDVQPPLRVEVVTVDSDGTRVLQRDRWIFQLARAN